MQETLEKTRQVFCRNPKRSSLLIGFAGLAIILCGRAFLNGPASAPASMIHPPITVNTVPPGTHAEPNNAVLDWLAQPIRPLRRNLFASKSDLVSPEPKIHSANLELQTTIMQDPPRAMVNGQLVQEGDTIDGYTIVKIQPRKIFVQQDGPVIEVEMP